MPHDVTKTNLTYWDKLFFWLYFKWRKRKVFSVCLVVHMAELSELSQWTIFFIFSSGIFLLSHVFIFSVNPHIPLKEKFCIEHIYIVKWNPFLNKSCQLYFLSCVVTNCLLSWRAQNLLRNKRRDQFKELSSELQGQLARHRINAIWSALMTEIVIVAIIRKPWEFAKRKYLKSFRNRPERKIIASETSICYLYHDVNWLQHQNSSVFFIFS